MVVNCIRYFGYISPAEIDRLSIRDITLLMRGVELREIDNMHHIHMQAYQTFRAQGRKQVGKNKTKAVYTTYRKFFDYEKELRKVRDRNKPSKFEVLRKKLKEKANE